MDNSDTGFDSKEFQSNFLFAGYTQPPFSMVMEDLFYGSKAVRT
jgi:hypothetical protein